jgi:group I intron endonuclease
MRRSNSRAWTGIIYLIRNLVNGKGYVGQTILTSRKRWSLHKSGARRGEGFPIYRAIRKYGAENFSIKVLASVNPQQLDDLEKKYIKDLNTHVDNGCGYNCDEGGRGNRGFFSKETRLKVSAIQKARGENNPELRALWGAAIRALRAAHPEILLRQAESMRAHHACHPETAQEHGDDMRNFHSAHPEFTRKHSGDIHRLWQDVDWRAAVIASQKLGYLSDPNRAPKHAKNMTEIWQNPEFQSKMSAIQTARYGSLSERLKTSAACQASGKIRNGTGYKGVSKHGSGWAAKIKYCRDPHHLGTYSTPEEAALAYNKKALELFGPSAFQNRILADKAA